MKKSERLNATNEPKADILTKGLSSAVFLTFEQMTTCKKECYDID